jgi:hypothetical protein
VHVVKTNSKETKMSTLRKKIFVTKLSWLLLIVLALLTGSCASGPKANIKDIDWGKRIGAYTYKEAGAELGEPNVISETNEGTIAEWVLRRSPKVSVGFGLGGGGYGSHTGAGVGVGTSVSPPPSGEYLRLRFDKNGTLTESARVRY